MKFSLVALPLLSAFVIAAPASGASLAVRADVSSELQSMLTGLLATVKQYTGSMNQTLAALGSNPSDELKQVAAKAVVQDISGITSAIHSANTQVAAASQPTLADLPNDVLGQLNGQPIVFAKLLLPIIQELDPALQSVLVTLSLGEVNTAIQPLLKVELPTLVTGLGNLVNGLLAALSPLLAGLGGILAPVLTGLGL